MPASKKVLELKRQNALMKLNMSMLSETLDEIVDTGMSAVKRLQQEEGLSSSAIYQLAHLQSIVAKAANLRDKLK